MPPITRSGRCRFFGFFGFMSLQVFPKVKSPYCILFRWILHQNDVRRVAFLSMEVEIPLHYRLEGVFELIIFIPGLLLGVVGCTGPFDQDFRHLVLPKTLSGQ